MAVFIVLLRSRMIYGRQNNVNNTNSIVFCGVYILSSFVVACDKENLNAIKATTR